MSKNERFFRTLAAGLVFVAIGVIGSLVSDEVGEPRKPARVPAASADCASLACAELARVKSELIEKSGAKADSAKLTEAGRIIAGMLKAGETRETARAELIEITLFLVETADRDGAGITLVSLRAELGEAKTAAAITAIRATLDPLFAENRIQPAQRDTYLATLAAFNR